MAPKIPFAGLSLFFTAGGLLLLFLVLLAGTDNHNPLNQIYFLQVDTSNIPGAPTTSRWTFWNLCPVTTGGRNKCGKVHPAFPLDPPSNRNFNTRINVPKAFIGTSQYFYITRFMFAFMLISMFFAVMALFTSLLALCSRIGSYLSAFLNMIALFFLAITNALMTSAYVLGRDKFRSNGQKANIGKFAFAFMWAGWACLLISVALVCVAGRSRGKDKTYTAKSSNKRSFPRFGRKEKAKSTKSRGSFVDGRIKDDYA